VTGNFSHPYSLHHTKVTSPQTHVGQCLTGYLQLLLVVIRGFCLVFGHVLHDDMAETEDWLGSGRHRGQLHKDRGEKQRARNLLTNGIKDQRLRRREEKRNESGTQTTSRGQKTHEFEGVELGIQWKRANLGGAREKDVN